MVNNQFRNQMNQPMTSMAPGMPVSSPMMGRPLAARLVILESSAFFREIFILFTITPKN